MPLYLSLDGPHASVWRADGSLVTIGTFDSVCRQYPNLVLIENAPDDDPYPVDDRLEDPDDLDPLV